MREINIYQIREKFKPRAIAFSLTFGGLILLTLPASLIRWDGRIGVPIIQEQLLNEPSRQIPPWLGRTLRLASNLGAIASFGLGAYRWHIELKESQYEQAEALARNDIYGAVMESQVRDITKEFQELERQETLKKLMPNVRSFDPRLLQDYTLYPHIRVLGETRGGKTHTVMRLLKWLDSHQIILAPKVNPHKQDWRGYQVVGAGHNYPEIEQALLKVLDQMRQRQRTYQYDKPMDVVIDDATLVCQKVDCFGDVIKELILLSGDVEVRLWLVVHMDSMAALNLPKGNAELIENLKTVYIGKFAHREINRLVNKASDGEEARYYQARKEWLKSQPRACVVVDQPLDYQLVETPPQLLKGKPEAPQQIYDSQGAEAPYQWVDFSPDDGSGEQLKPGNNDLEKRKNDLDQGYRNGDCGEPFKPGNNDLEQGKNSLNQGYQSDQFNGWVKPGKNHLSQSYQGGNSGVTFGEEVTVGKTAKANQGKEITALDVNLLSLRIEVLSKDLGVSALKVTEALELLIWERETNPGNKEFRGLKKKVLWEILGVKGRKYSNFGDEIWQFLIDSIDPIK